MTLMGFPGNCAPDIRLTRTDAVPPQRWKRLGTLLFALGSAGSASAAMVTLHPNLDNTIYSESNASNAQGGLFIGETPNQTVRRALLSFDLAAGGVPAGAIIDAVSLSVVQIKIGPGGESLVELHPLLAAWGEGTSFGTGAGGAATTSDATWNFRLFSSASWTTPGGDFGATSGTANFGTANATYTFNSTPAMVANVQNWLNTPAANFGWLIRAANESPGITSAREIGSGESALAQQPTLTITYTVPEPCTGGLVGIGLVVAMTRAGRNPRKNK